MHARSITIADYSTINCLLQTLVFLSNIGILSIVSGSKKTQNWIYFKLFSVNTSREKIPERIVYLTH